MPEEKPGFERYKADVATFMAEYMAPILKPHVKGEHITRPTDHVAEELLYGFGEITEAIDNLEMIKELTRLAPPRSKRIRPDAYLKLQISSYLQEIYILDQRLRSHAAKMCRYYRSNPTKVACDELVQAAFQGILQTRGSHVHVSRYWDKEINYLQMVHLASQFELSLRADAAFEYKFVRLRWSTKMKENHKALIALLDQYFSLMHEMITKNGQIFLPSTGGRPPRDAPRRR